MVLKTPDDIRKMILLNEKASIIDLRESEVKFETNFSITIIRCFINTPDSGVLSNVGWVLNDGNHLCLLCQNEFGFLRWRHHCRTCGTLVCNRCSPHHVLIASKEEYGQVKICNNCYRPNLESIPVLNNRHEGVSLLKNYSIPASNDSMTNLTSTETQGNTQDDENSSAQPENSSTLSPTSRKITKTEEKIFKLMPNPGYVIKTHRPNDEKVFINVYHHESLHPFDEQLSLLATLSDPLIALDKQNSSEIIPYFYIGKPMTTFDKIGSQSSLYNVVISSSYFQVNNTKKCTDVLIIQKIMEALNKTFNDTMVEEDYVRPRVKCGYKGSPIPSDGLECVVNTQSVSLLLRIKDDSDLRSVYTRTTTQSYRPVDYTQAYEQRINNMQQPSNNTTSITNTNTNSTTSVHSTSLPNISYMNGRPPSWRQGSLPPSNQFTKGQSFSDSISEVSDLTCATGDGIMIGEDGQPIHTTQNPNTKSKRTSILTTLIHGKYGTNGRELLTEDMLSLENSSQYPPVEKIDLDLLMVSSVRKPKVLLGWMIKLHSDGTPECPPTGVYVITALRKNSMRKTEFRISTIHGEDQWVRLKRSDDKSGYVFRPLRKVLKLPE